MVSVFILYVSRIKALKGFWQNWLGKNHLPCVPDVLSLILRTHCGRKKNFCKLSWPLQMNCMFVCVCVYMSFQNSLIIPDTGFGLWRTGKTRRVSSIWASDGKFQGLTRGFQKLDWSYQVWWQVSKPTKAFHWL